ncbi:MAG: tRNA preQ1(34) S-adenosylmethionine ribosyltransferase-isomerase QueA, partial [Thiotrichaceae bacterium]|nr:tRNA preQ1(34) S-adenosylmethionine ribosyltransferase-isomerase QueA [Thiotrichaceae bacterium]
MKRSDFNFDLPEELIAQFPSKNRSDSRLLCVDGNRNIFDDKSFKHIINLLNPGDLLVLNNTQVIAARLYGKKITGGKIEVLIERILSSNSAMVKIRSSKSPKTGSTINLGVDRDGTGFKAQVSGRDDDLFKIEINPSENIYDLLEQYGHIPLPPYVKRDDNDIDVQRYQTVYASKPGAVAAPTAGLHFDSELLESLKRKGVNSSYITLHVGAGTYQPVRADNIVDHKMHSEYIHIDEKTAQLINQTKASGNRVIAVGTTSLRSLESSATFNPADQFMAYEGDSDIFIYPGYKFK